MKVYQIYEKKRKKRKYKKAHVNKIPNFVREGNKNQFLQDGFLLSVYGTPYLSPK